MTTSDIDRGVAAIRSFLQRSGGDARRRTLERERWLREQLARVARVLYESGATRVWALGSLVWGGLHPGSDLDLAVEGLPVARRTELHEALWALVGEPVDLVMIESCAPELRARILSAGEWVPR